MFWFVSLDSIGKYLMQSYPLVQVVWARYFFHLLFVLVLMGRRLPEQIKSHSPKNQCARSFFLFATTILFFIGISRLPLATATTIMFMSPIMVTILSIPLLKENVGIRRWMGVLVAFAGALIVVRPGDGPLEISMLVLLVAANR